MYIPQKGQKNAKTWSKMAKNGRKLQINVKFQKLLNMMKNDNNLKNVKKM